MPFLLDKTFCNIVNLLRFAEGSKWTDFGVGLDFKNQAEKGFQFFIYFSGRESESCGCWVVMYCMKEKDGEKQSEKLREGGP